MKLMKKNAVSVLALCALMLTGCGTSASNTTAGTSAEDKKSEGTIDPDKQIEVVWWNNYQTPDSSKTEEENRANRNYFEYYYATDLIAEFEKDNPNIHISMEYKGNYTQIYEAIKSGIDSGNIPTIASTYQDNVAYYLEQEVSYDMTELASVLEKDTDFNQTYLSIEKGAFNGKYYSLPYSKSSETLAVNQTVFDQEGAGESGTDTTKYTAPTAASSKKKYSIPQNFYEMIETARQMKADYPEVFENQRDEKGNFTAVPFCWDSAENMIITILKNAGLVYTDGNGDTMMDKICWNTEAVKDIVKQLKKWNNEGLICTQNQLPYTNEAKDYHEYSSTMVTTGKIFMAVTSTAGASYFAADGGLQVSLNHGLNWNEGSKTSEAYVISQGPSLTFFADKDEDVNKAAFKFYQYLTNTENCAKLAVNKSYFPIRTSSYQTDSVKALTNAANTTNADSSYSEKYNDYTGQALNLNKTYTDENAYFMSDVFSGSADVRTAFGKIITTVFNKSVDETDTDDELDAVVDQAFKDAYNSLLA